MATTTKKAKKSAKKAPSVRVSFCTFDDRADRPVFREVRTSALDAWTPLTDETYTPWGSTPLHDATVSFIEHLGRLQADGEVVVGVLADESGSMAGNHQAVLDGVNEFVGGLGSVTSVDAKASGKVLAVVFTDGLENASKHATKDDVAKLVKAREDDGWTFIYLGANQDAWSTGSGMGLSGGVTGQSVNFMATDKGTRSALRATTSDAIGYLNDNDSYVAARASTAKRSLTEDGDEVAENTALAPDPAPTARPRADGPNARVAKALDEARDSL